MTAALASLFVCSAIGSGAVRRWRRALTWLLTEWALLGIVAVATVAGHSLLFVMALSAVFGCRFVALLDAYRLVTRAVPTATWPMFVAAGVVLGLMNVGFSKGVIRPWFAEAFQMPSTSMYPTLLIGDHIMVDKLHTSPKRGDIIVFKYPLDPSTDYVKRIVGMPGDVIELSADGVAVNGHALPRERFQDECPKRPDGEARPLERGQPCVLWHETADARTYDVATESTTGELRGFERNVVPPGRVFVLGDNRDNSSDSRVWGPVPLENIKGAVRFIWWSLGASGIRWDRVGASVR
jgi:signal peptidase I